MLRANSKTDTSTRSPAILIRRARKSDLPLLQALYDQLHLNTYLSMRVPPAKFGFAFNKIARSRNHSILVAEIAGRIVGTCHLIIVPHLGHALKPFAVVENVVVDEKERSSGVGERLMEAATEIARGHRCYKMALTTNVARLRAHRFYERLGWKRTHFGYSLALE
ncbi:MAG TPA: GNAT family N-acetyltransferase [Candidatus Binataceae bacterium]|nr:GNAT family N-acetyltransferase [Candidatus Binataceae bacterium]